MTIYGVAIEMKMLVLKTWKINIFYTFIHLNKTKLPYLKKLGYMAIIELVFPQFLYLYFDPLVI